VFGGWVVAVVLSTIVGGLVLAAFGYGDDADAAPLFVVVLTNLPFWLGLVGAAVWATTVKGNGPVRDLRLTMRPLDVPLGLAVGIAAQLLVAPLYWLLSLLIGDDPDVSAEARELTDRADGAAGIVALLLIVGIGAPVAEEIFYRGLTQSAFEKRGMRWGLALVLTAALFAISHLQVLQLPALFLFGLLLGWLVRAFGRLGPALWSHMAFNVTAALVLVWGN
jgi:membrane protease YdiL (CAAX protease family)